MPATLLAVDDSLTMRKVLELTFAGEDFRVVTAASAETALAMISSESPAIVLADISLPDKNGYDLCTDIKRSSPGLPVLLLSSKFHPYEAPKGLAAKADGYIDKPFDTQKLIDRVQELLKNQSVRAPKLESIPHLPGVRKAPSQPLATGTVPSMPAAQIPAPPVVAAPSPVAGRRPPTLVYSGHSASVLRTGQGLGPAPSPAAPVRPFAVQAQRTQPGVSASPAVYPKAPVAPQTQEPELAARPAHAQPPGAAPAFNPAATLTTGMSAPPTPVVGMHPAGMSHKAPVEVRVGQNRGLHTTMQVEQYRGETDMSSKLRDLGLDQAQVNAVLNLSREVVERVVWEVVPVLAETMIREEIKRVTEEA